MNNSFDPDAYLAATSPSDSGSGSFDPDAYIKATGQSPNAPYTGPIPASPATSDVLERSPNYPNAKMTDPSVSDYMTAQGAIGLGKLGAGLIGKIGGTTLDTVLPALSEAPLGGVESIIPNTENVIPSIERVANNQTLKSLGGTMNQLKGMEEQGGREALDKAAEVARESGLTDVFSTSVGRDQKLADLLKESGEKIGALRESAGPASEDVLESVSNDPALAKYFGSGSAGKEIGGVKTAMNDIEEVGGQSPTNSSLAKAATYINENAAGNKLYQPVNAETDVANSLSRANNADIAQKLGSDNAKQYVEALDKQSSLHPLEHLQQHGELREAGGRGGLGTRIIQAIADKAGYRMTAKTAAQIADFLNGKTLSNAASEAVSPTARFGNFSASKAIPAAISEWMNKRQE